MGSDTSPLSDPSRTPPKVVGLGAPISVWAYLEVAEIPALRDALAEEIARHGERSQRNGRSVDLEPSVNAAARSDHLGELHQMLQDVERAAAMRSGGRFDVLWPTVLARNAVRGAAAHAERRAAMAVHDETAAHALAAARNTLRDFEAVDNGGLANVWL